MQARPRPHGEWPRPHGEWPRPRACALRSAARPVGPPSWEPLACLPRCKIQISVRRWKVTVSSVPLSVELPNIPKQEVTVGLQPSAKLTWPSKWDQPTGHFPREESGDTGRTLQPRAVQAGHSGCHLEVLAGLCPI